MKHEMYIAIHGGTGQYTLRTRWIQGNQAVPGKPSLEAFHKSERLADPIFLMLKGDIDAGRKTRKRSVWTREKDSIFFTCPWCGAVGSTYALRNLSFQEYLDSRYCDRCGRHLFLVFRNGDEEELVYLERKEDK